MPLGTGRVSLLSIFIRLLRFFFGDGIGDVDITCYWSNFCSIFVYFKFTGTVKVFLKNTYHHVCMRALIKILSVALQFNFTLRPDTWSRRWFINISNSFNGVLLIGALNISTSFFKEFVSVKNAYVRGLSYSIFQKLKLVFYIKNVSTSIFGIERHTIFQTELLSIRTFKFLLRISRKVYFFRENLVLMLRLILLYIYSTPHFLRF